MSTVKNPASFNEKKSMHIKISRKNQAKRFTRSRVGNFFYILFLVCFGLFSILPLIYSIITAFKPLEELLVFPPKFYVVRPTLQNFLDLPAQLATIPLTGLPRKAGNSTFAKKSVRSQMISGLRRSGLSEPYFIMDSA